jgi:lipid II:glycine glycyltransferase (peptidoglycan interpeptide bridge formation enzyme)
VWSEVLRKGLGGQPLYFCLREGEDIVAGLPGLLLNFRLFKIFYASIPYGNMIGDKTFYPPLMELLEKEFQGRGIDQVRITDSPFLEPYSPKDFKWISAKCSLLDLKRFNGEEISQGYKGDIRRAIRKAQKNGLSIKGATSPEETKIFYQLYLSSMERNRTGAKYPFQWFQALYDILIRQGKADIRFAMKGDHYAAGVVLVYSSTSIHYLHNGSDPAHLPNRPNDLIVDDIIREGTKEGKAVLDFMGSDSEDLNLLRFKEKWGSQSLDIHTYVKNYHPLRCAIWEIGKRSMASRLGGRLLTLFRK